MKRILACMLIAVLLLTASCAAGDGVRILQASLPRGAESSTPQRKAASIPFPWDTGA